MQPIALISLVIALLAISSKASHYRGGSFSWTIREGGDNRTINQPNLPVRITQRHSWRRSYGKDHFCDRNTIRTSGLIGQGELINVADKRNKMSAMVQCTDFNEQFDYSSGEITREMVVSSNKTTEYVYAGCCWIELLPPDLDDKLNWSLKVVVNTNRRQNGKLNNSPKSAMNPIVEVQLGQTHIIRIPMADSDGDSLRCRWGRREQNECGSVCSPKGPLNPNPCELTYNATRLGYAAVAVVVEDYDSNNKVLSSIPVQFLIHIVEKMVQNDSTSCMNLPVYIGDRPQDACIGVESNSTVIERLRFRIVCVNTTTSLNTVLTISPPGMVIGPLVRDPSDPNLYVMQAQWTPKPDQYGIHQLCLTPVDSQQQTGSQVCLTFQVDVQPPEFVRLHPTGIVAETQSEWTIDIDRDIVAPRRLTGVNIRFFKQSNHQEVYSVDVASNSLVRYESRRIIFRTSGYRWEQGEKYYILLDSGVAVINESCGIESAPLMNYTIWTFQIERQTTLFIPYETTNEPKTSPSTMRITTTKLLETSASPLLTTKLITSANPFPTTPSEASTSSTDTICKLWLPFNTFLNITTNEDQQTFVFCFHVTSHFADVTIAANTWVSCPNWKMSGAADPLIELHSENSKTLLAENDDGNSIPSMNCYSSVISYRLPRGDYRVVIRSSKCAYGYFELRFQAEIPSA